MTPKLSILIIASTLTILFASCGSSNLISTPIENIDKIPLKVSELTDIEQKTWSHLDLIQDTIPGMSVQKAYKELIKNKKGTTTIVAVIDSGIDIDHEDLHENIWTNKNEIANNGIDDDQNGYIDDLHGWNFLGEAYFEQFEYVRLLSSENTSHPRYNEALEEYNSAFLKYSRLKSNHSQFIRDIELADTRIVSHLKTSTYSKKDLKAITSENNELREAIRFMTYVFSLNFETVVEAKKAFNNSLETITNRLDYHLNKSFKGRKTNDNPDDLNDKIYGNSNVKPRTKNETHGTHVAGIIAAKRHNKKGVDGIANNVQIMAIRNTPNGDEYDKDVALAIRYAVDNGAKIINMSFGKYYTSHSDWVRDAIIYAGVNDVLIVHGSGNEALNLDTKNNFPNDQINNGEEVSDNFLSVSATEPHYGSGLLAKYSNYGKINVDVFAPGSDIYSTFPGDSYESIQGTSMSAPAVAGVAALIRSQYPSLSASQVKHILMDSGLSITTRVIVPGDTGDIKQLSQLSKSGKIVNAYAALLKAKQVARQ